MLTFTGPVEAIGALQDLVFDRPEPIPDDVRGRIRQLLKERSPVVGVTRGVELIYARHVSEADIADELKDWASAAAAMAEDFGFHGMADSGRGSKIARVLRGQKIGAADVPTVRESVG